MKSSLLTFFKALLSVPIAIGLLYPLLNPSASGGVLNELKIFGSTISALIVFVFLLFVLFYALDLIKLLNLVSPESRKVNPNSVWLMFLLPYNFIEDFFIIFHVATSIEKEASINSKISSFKTFGKVSGFGWCLAQIVSLSPNDFGSIAGLVALIFWYWHWMFIRRVNKTLMA